MRESVVRHELRKVEYDPGGSEGDGGTGVYLHGKKARREMDRLAKIPNVN
jgi:hypothetical protein